MVIAGGVSMTARRKPCWRSTSRSDDEPRDGGLGEGRHVVGAFVPPVGERPLRIDVDKADGAGSSQLRLHRKMAGQGRLARSALLRCHCQNAHSIPLAQNDGLWGACDAQASNYWLMLVRPCCAAARLGKVGRRKRRGGGADDEVDCLGCGAAARRAPRRRRPCARGSRRGRTAIMPPRSRSGRRLPRKAMPMPPSTSARPIASARAWRWTSAAAQQYFEQAARKGHVDAAGNARHPAVPERQSHRRDALAQARPPTAASRAPCCSTAPRCTMATASRPTR